MALSFPLACRKRQRCQTITVAGWTIASQSCQPHNAPGVPCRAGPANAGAASAFPAPARRVAAAAPGFRQRAPPDWRGCPASLRAA